MARQTRFSPPPTARQRLEALYKAASRLPLPEDFDGWLAELMGLRQDWKRAEQREKRRKT